MHQVWGGYLWAYLRSCARRTEDGWHWDTWWRPEVNGGVPWALRWSTDSSEWLAVPVELWARPRSHQSRSVTSDDGPGPVTMSREDARWVWGFVYSFVLSSWLILFFANSAMGLSCRGIKEIIVPRKKTLEHFRLFNYTASANQKHRHCLAWREEN